MTSCNGCDERDAQIDDLKKQLDECHAQIDDLKKQIGERDARDDLKLSLRRDAPVLSNEPPLKKAKKPKTPKLVETPKESALQKAVKKIVKRDAQGLPLPRDDDKHFNKNKIDNGYVMCPGKLDDHSDSCGVLVVSSPSKLAEHLNTTKLHGNKASFKCSKCEEKFTSRQLRTDHHNVIHLGIVYKCQYEGCEEREPYSSSNGLHNHIEVHHKGTKYPCTVDNCSKIFNSSSKRGVHINVVHKGQRFPCNQCAKEYTGYQSLDYHVFLCHSIYSNIYSDQLQLFLTGDEATIEQAKDDVRVIMDLFKDGAVFEEQGSGNYIQYLDNDAKTLAEALQFFNYVGAETPGSGLEGIRARNHNNEFKKLLEGKIENPTEKLLNMKQAHLDGKEIKYVQFGQDSYSALAFARESAIIIAIGLHNLSNTLHGKHMDNIFGFMGKGIEQRKRIAGVGSYWLNEMFNERFSM